MLIASKAPRHMQMSTRLVVGEEQKRAWATHDAPFCVKEVFAVGEMSGQEREILRDRLQSDLVAVRGILKKIEFFVVPQAVEGGAAPSSPSLAAPRGNGGGGLRSSEPMEAENSKVAKRRKTSPAVKHVEEPKMTPAEREQLAFRLVVISAKLSSNAVELLQKQRDGRRQGEIELDVYSMDDAALFELKAQVDKIVRTKIITPREHQDGNIVDEEKGDEQEECVGICEGVSAMAIAPSPPQLGVLEHGVIFDPTGVDHVLSPLQQKYVSLAENVEEEEEEEYVDICGDASPVVIQNFGEIISSSSSDSDSDSDSDSVSDSDSDPNSGEKAPAPAVLSEVNDDSSRPSEPEAEMVKKAEPGNLSDQCVAAQEKVQNAEPLPDQRAAVAPPARSISELIAEAQEKRQKEERSRARDKVRQVLAEMERMAITSDRIHPMEMERLGIAGVEHSVSTAERSLIRPSLLQQLGLFLKTDEDDDDDDGEERQPGFFHPPRVEDLEEGEIR